MSIELKIGDFVKFEVDETNGVNGRKKGMLIKSTVRAAPPYIPCFYVEGHEFGFYFNHVIFLKEEEEEEEEEKEEKEYPFYKKIDQFLEENGHKQRKHTFVKDSGYCNNCGRPETKCMYSPKFQPA